MPLSPADIGQHKSQITIISPETRWFEAAVLQVDAHLGAASEEFTDFYFALDADEAPEMDDYNALELVHAYLKAGWFRVAAGSLERRRWITQRSKGPHCMVRYAGRHRDQVPEYLMYLRLAKSPTPQRKPGWFERTFPAWRTR